MQESTHTPQTMAATNATAQPEMERLEKATQNEEAKAAGTSSPSLANEPVDLNHEEYQYLSLIRGILQNGEHRPDRYAFPSCFPEPI